ncbi:MAG: Rha family transcriptional regulator [Methylomicrobium sp.]|nr:Rha family transcriptional regulator [Methylomicrobium sp.]
MNNLMTNKPTMSSREIAELTEKQHSDVLHDIRTQLYTGLYNHDFDKGKNLYQQIQGFTVIIDEQTKRTKEILLDRYHTDILISGYNVKYRAAIVTRWYELESKSYVPKSFVEALRLAADTQERLEEAERQRLIAVQTKAEIGNRREATAMNTASQATKRVNRLEIESDKSKDYCSIKRAEMLHHGQKFDWRLLKSASAEMDIPPTKVFDQNYGTVNAYHVDVWFETYAVII